MLKHGIAELSGMTILGCPPFDLAHIPFAEGTTILYGENGVGKTRALQLIRTALDGVKPDAGRLLLHGSIGDTSSGGFDIAAMRSALAVEREITDIVTDTTSEVPETYSTFIWYAMEIARAVASRPSSQLGASLHAQEALKQFDAEEEDTAPRLVVVLEPVGTATSPKWAVSFGAPMDEPNSRGDFNSYVLSGSAADGTDPYEGRFAVGADAPDWPVTYQIDTNVFSGSDENIIATLAEWPEWACIPTLEIATLDSIGARLDVQFLTNEHLELTDTSTRNLVVHTVGRVLDASAGSEVAFSSQAVELVEELSRAATDVVHPLFPELTLSFDLRHPEHWLAGALPEWRAQIGKETLPLTALSGAASRWARIAISVALRRLGAEYVRRRREDEDSNSPLRLLKHDASETIRLGSLDEFRGPIFLVDEPESGLSRRTELALPAAFNQLKAPVFVASHSPSLIATQSSLLHVVKTPEKVTSVVRDKLKYSGSSLAIHEAAAEIGLTPADILQLTRTFVCVEGQHDEVVLRGLIGEPFRQPTNQLLRLNGAKNLVGSLFVPAVLGATDARFVVVLDNASAAATHWHDARKLLRHGKKHEARAVVSAMNAIDSGEAKWLARLADECIDDPNYFARVEVFGLSAPDIICYLPPSTLLKDNESNWSETINTWNRHRENKADFKKWLVDTKRMERVTTTRLNKALASHDTELAPLHNDLVKLLELLRAQ